MPGNDEHLYLVDDEAGGLTWECSGCGAWVKFKRHTYGCPYEDR